MQTVNGLSIGNRVAADLPRCVKALAEVHEQNRYPIVWPADPALWLSPADLLMAWIAVRPHGVVGHIALVGNGDTLDGLEASGQPLALISRLFVTPQLVARRLARGSSNTLRPGPHKPDCH